ncbi:MAG TPA: hypothetical protein VFU19_11520 [Iamia sp.]|nr:hypothetical protein [Iamia sp.]
MLLTALDHWRFRRRQGRYGDDPAHNFMALGATAADVDALVENLREDDHLLLQGRTTTAWATMNFSNSLVSHVGVHAGDGHIAHPTPAGPRYDPVVSLVDRETRILGVRVDGKMTSLETVRHNSHRIQFTADLIASRRAKQSASELAGERFGVRVRLASQVVKAAPKLLTGHWFARSRPATLVDTVLCWTAIETAVLRRRRRPPSFVVVPLAVIALNLGRFHAARARADRAPDGLLWHYGWGESRTFTTPDLAIFDLLSRGGTLITRHGPVRVEPVETARILADFPTFGLLAEIADRR